jgi:NTE family protein
MRFQPDTAIKNSLRSVLLCCFSLILLFLFLNPVEIYAQETAGRPKIGLALSGGGALGIAHLGVIKVMEEAGLRPDYITGVSMGSIIGGMYSIGYSADSLKKLLKAMDWDLLLSNKIPENKVIFPEKKHFHNSIISFPISFRKIMLPQGLINGQQIENTLSFYGWPAADINDFSKLPIPFMCLATDIISFRKVELKTGYLPDAIRASIAVPSIFTPIKNDTALLADGGLVRNFAASELKAMGADIIIGSYTGFRTYPEEELQSVSGIIKQISLSRSAADFKEQRKLVDLVIEPRVKDLTRLEFKNVDTIVHRGYVAALPYKNYFKKLADSLNTIGEQTPIKNILDKQFYTFDKIEVNGNDIYSDQQILGILDIKPGEKVDKYMLSNRIELLYGEAWFDKVKYRIVPQNDSLILVIECIEKPKTIFFGSVHYDNALGSGILASLSFKNLIIPGFVINLDSYLGQYYRTKNTFLQFIGKNQRFGLSFNLYADNTLIPKLNIKKETGDVVSNNLSAGFGINRIFGLNQMMNISVDFEKRYLIPRYVSEINLSNISYNYITTALSYKISTLDDRHFPDKGMIFNFYAGSSDLTSGSIKTGASRKTYKNDNPGGFVFDRFYTITGNYEQYFPLYDRLTFSLSGDALYISDCDSVSSQNNFFLLGGITSLNGRSVPMVGFHQNEIPVKKLAGLGMGLDWKILKDLHLNLAGNIFAVQEADREKGYSLLAGYGLGIGYMSIIGPLEAGIMQGFYGQEKYFKRIKAYISVGYQF